jgi:hypothetical protein
MTYDSQQLTELMRDEIKLIQDIIKRMAFNSFMLKGWTVTLVAIALLLGGTKYQTFISFIPLLAFSFLDAYYLWQERLYRRLYNWVIANRS